jgi:hypothetical protein
MKCLHLTLRFAQLGCRTKSLADGFSVHLPGQTEVGTVAGLIGLVTMAVGLTAAALDGGDGAAAEIAQIHNLRENFQALPFEGVEGIGQAYLLLS